MKENLLQRIFFYLQIRPASPSAENLAALLRAYTRRVPWESASRITKRASTKEISDCPRWPEKFWNDAIEHGCGGTCFESNYAFFTLLRSLGYQGYLTINNMGDIAACHTAIILHLDGRRWLADVGIPLYAPIPIDERKISRGQSQFHHYTLKPLGTGVFQVERDRHPNPYIFTLIDTPINDPKYRRATTRDYSKDGYFLDRVILNKVIGDQVWHFNSAERPLHLEEFRAGRRYDHPLDKNIPALLAGHFGMEIEVLQQALKVVNHF